MPIDLTPADDFPNPSAPHGSDSRSDAVMQTILQTYADRTQYAALRAAENEARLDAVEAVYSSATFQLAAGSTSPVPLSVLSTAGNIGNPDGYSIVSGNQIQCPSAGRFIVSWGATMTNSSTSTGVMAGLNLEVQGSGLAFVIGTRFSATNTDRVYVSRSYAVRVSNPSLDRIRFTIYAPSGTASVNNGLGDQYNVVSVVQVA